MAVLYRQVILWKGSEMADELLSTQDIEEALSLAIVGAIAARAGYVTAKKDFDRDGIDLTIEAGDHMRPKIDLQLKASVKLDPAKDPMPYACPRRNYDLLRGPTQTPRLLVVVHLPRDAAQWLTISPTELTLRHAAYWLSLRDEPETDVGDNKTVYIPLANRLDVPMLGSLMAQSRTGIIR